MAASFLGRECNNGTILWSPRATSCTIFLFFLAHGAG
ncbi:hypothetical protein NC651_028509 [Populus alba x Populus x berolinensis]|nr:hypothetical protein NC651_028509 [Populus alba x Populus x berolinensis]